MATDENAESPNIKGRVRLTTANSWKYFADPTNKWLVIESDPYCVTKVRCRICAKYHEELKSFRNFSSSFVTGVTGQNIKKDNVLKHQKSEQHVRAMMMEHWNKPSDGLEVPSRMDRLNAAVGTGLKGQQPTFIQSTGAADAVKVKVEVTDKHASRGDGMDQQMLVQEMDEARSDMKEAPPSNDENELKVTEQRLIELTYMMAREEIDFNKFPAIVELEKHHQVELGTDASQESFEQLTKCIGEVFRKDLKQELLDLNDFSILIDRVHEFDGFEDVLLVYILFVDAKTGKLEIRFLKLVPVGDGSSENILLALRGILEDFEITSRFDKLIGLGYDGIDASFDLRNETLAFFRGHVSWLVGGSGYSHRLEESVKEMLSGQKMAEVIEVLILMKRMYEKMPVKCVVLKRVASIVENLRSEPEKWVQHIYLACKEVTVNSSRISKCLNVTSKNFPVRKIFEKMSSCDFFTTASFLQSFMMPLDRASQALQRSSLETGHLLSSLQHAKDSVINFPRVDGKTLAELIGEFQSGGSTSEIGNPGLERDNVAQGTRNLIKPDENSDQSKSTNDISGHVVEKMNKLLNAVSSRLDLGDEKTIEVAQILDTRLWPSDTKALQEYGNSLIRDSATSNFANIFLPDVDELLSEWNAFKLFASRCLLSLKPADVWGKLHVHYRADYPHLAKLIEVLRLFPYSPELLGKCFSTLGKARQDWRATLGLDTMEALLRIKHCGPPLKEFSAREVAEFFPAFKETCALGECKVLKMEPSADDAKARELDEESDEPARKRPCLAFQD
ncbi:uncharacterized protein LOC135494523 [Lineus longissimus]|uniref:uncharacterized protein LOC135494523 n=1 Tax=Lineus longissimus TaxID=88925 RepID=UPI00315C4DFB